jgi:hypothetical protein
MVQFSFNFLYTLATAYCLPIQIVDYSPLLEEL